VAKYEARVKTEFGELTIHFDSIEELDDNLKSIDVYAVANSITAKLGKILVPEQRQPKPGFEDIYRFTIDGYVELLKIPTEKVDTIGVVLFAFEPSPATVEQISRSSGVTNASVYLGQPRYQKYFSRTEDGYLLTHDGKSWVFNEVIPRLRPQLQGS